MLNLNMLTVTEQHEAPIPGVPMSADFKPTLSQEERATARALYLALQQFTALRPTMPLQYVMTFLLVAMEEGKGVTEYAKMAEVPPTVMTRHLLDIGDLNREREAGGAVFRARLTGAALLLAAIGLVVATK